MQSGSSDSCGTGAAGASRLSRAWAAVAVMATIYAVVFAAVSLLRYFNYDYHDWDLATYNQVFRGFLKGRPYMSLPNLPYMGLHSEVSMLLFLPFYAICPSPATLLVMQSIVLSLACVPLFLLTRRILNERWGIIFVCLYLLHPAVGFANLNEFHPESLLPLMQFSMFYYFVKCDFRKYAVTVLLCLFAKENMGLIVFMMGLYAVVERRSTKWWAFPAVGGLAWFLVYIKWLSPLLVGGPSEFYNFYGHMGKDLGEMLGYMVRYPFKTMAYMFMPSKIEYLAQMLGQLSFLSLLSPLTLLVALPNLLQHLLSQRELEASLHFFYPIEALAVFFVAAVFGLKRMLNLEIAGKHYRAIAVVVVVVAVSFNAVLGPQLKMTGRLRKSWEARGERQWRDSMVALVPENESVVATFDFLPRLSAQTDRLYSFHRVLLARYAGRGPDNNVPDDVEYALIDFDDKLTFGAFFGMPGSQEDLLAYFPQGRWQIVDAIANTVLLKRCRGKAEDRGLYYVSEASVREDASDIVFDDVLHLLDVTFSSGKVKRGGLIDLMFSWKRSDGSVNDYSVELRMKSTNGRVFEQSHPICYRLRPVSSWGHKDLVTERFWLPVPVTLDAGVYELTMQVVAQREVCSVTGADAKGLRDRIVLGSVTVE